MFERNALAELREWAARANRKPLILRGARQVGKTTLVNEFAREFPVFLKLNLDKKADLGLFDTDMEVHELLTAIYMLHSVSLLSGLETLCTDPGKWLKHSVHSKRRCCWNLPIRPRPALSR